MLRCWVVVLYAFLATIPALGQGQNHKALIRILRTCASPVCGRARKARPDAGHCAAPRLRPQRRNHGPSVERSGRARGLYYRCSYGSAAWGSLVDPPELFQAVVDQVKAIDPVDESRIYLSSATPPERRTRCFSPSWIRIDSLPPQYMPELCRQTPTSSLNRQIARCPLQSGWAIADPNPNHDHNYYVISDQENAKAWDFLKNVRMPPAEPEAAPSSAGLRIHDD